MGRHSKVSSRGYRGRHRAPTTAGKTVARVATVGVVMSAAPLSMGAGVASAAPAPASPLEAIAECESGGSYTAQNRSSSASGKYQFIDSTWRAYRGSSDAARAKDASPAEQEAAARRLLAAEGTSPWNASRSCWAGKTSSVSASPQRAAASESDKSTAKKSDKSAAKQKPAPAAKKKSTAKNVPSKQRAAKVVPKAGNGKHVVVSGDTLSGLALRYTGDSWQQLHERNRDVVGSNPHLIVPGQVLEVRR